MTSKIHAAVDTNGLPIWRALTAGEAHDSRLAAKLSREQCYWLTVASLHRTEMERDCNPGDAIKYKLDTNKQADHPQT
jgi:hypothetical protein